MARILNITNQYRIPEGNPPGPPWASEGILYLKLTYSVTPDGLRFDYHSDSGFYPKAMYDIATFINAALRKELAPAQTPLPPATPPKKPLMFKVRQPCYVVVELHPYGNWEFRYDTDAMSTDVNFPADGIQYFNLRHVLNNGQIQPGQGIDTANPSNTVPAEVDKCRIAYFSAVHPSKCGGSSNPTCDHLNMFIRLTQMEPDQADPTTLDLIIDPDIQNTGHGVGGGNGGDGGDNTGNP